MEGFGSFLGLSSAQLRRSWGPFGLPLGLLLGASRCSWPHLGSLGCLCARFWGVLGASWLGFGELWGSFRYHFRRRCANCCRDPSMAFTLAFRYLLAARRYVRSSTWNRGWGGPGEAKFAQDASETRKERPTSVQEGAKSCLRSAQESPRAAQERPRAGQEAFGRCRNFSKILFGTLQILICTRSWPNCLFEKLSGRFLFVFCVMRWMASMLRCAFRTTPTSVL